MSKSKIEWTQETWNPVTGCAKVSPGCKNCYAEIMHARLTKMGQAKYKDPFSVVRTHEDALTDPLRWRRPRRVFVNSMSDLFHEDVPDSFIDQVFAVMGLCPQHTFQVLTKRPDRMTKWFLEKPRSDVVVKPEILNRRKSYVLYEAARIALAHGKRPDGKPPAWPLGNLHLGVSVENQEYAEKRILKLLACPAAVHFISAECTTATREGEAVKRGSKLNHSKLASVLGCVALRPHWCLGADWDGSNPMRPLPASGFQFEGADQPDYFFSQELEAADDPSVAMKRFVGLFCESLRLPEFVAWLEPRLSRLAAKAKAVKRSGRTP